MKFSFTLIFINLCYSCPFSKKIFSKFTQINLLFILCIKFIEKNKICLYILKFFMKNEIFPQSKQKKNSFCVRFQ